MRDGKDERSGLPIFSLYGERTRPAEAELAGIDALVFDLQDAGVSFSATSFTPSSSTFGGEACEGVAIRIDGSAAFDPIRAGLTIARALMTLYPADFQPKRLLLLLGNQATYNALGRGDPVEKIVASWSADLAAFASVRARYLLYP